METSPSAASQAATTRSKVSIVSREKLKRKHEGYPERSGERRMSLRLKQDKSKDSQPSPVTLDTKDGLCPNTKLSSPQTEPEDVKPSDTKQNLNTKPYRFCRDKKKQPLNQRVDGETLSSPNKTVDTGSENEVIEESESEANSDFSEVAESSENSQTDQKSPDFTSVLKCNKQKSKNKPMWCPVRKLRRHHILDDEEEEPQTSLAETLEKDEAETKEASPQMNLSQPFVLLKSVVVGDNEYQCELCSRTFTSVSKLVRHQQCKEGTVCCSTDQDSVVEPSLPCNMCSRLFSTVHSLKRHKLLHVRDGRKCRTCGVLFCKLHSNILILSQTRVSESDDEPAVEEIKSSDTKPMPKYIAPTMTEISKTAQPENESDPWNFVPLLATKNRTALIHDSTPHHLPPGPSAGYFKIPSEFPTQKCSPSVPAEPQSTSVTSPNSECCFKPKPADYPADFIQPHLPSDPKMPPGLEMFSSHYLTSSYLEVRRNYDYILKWRKDLKAKVAAQQPKTQPSPSAQTSEERAENKIIIYELPCLL